MPALRFHPLAPRRAAAPAPRPPIMRAAAKPAVAAVGVPRFAAARPAGAAATTAPSVRPAAPAAASRPAPVTTVANLAPRPEAPANFEAKPRAEQLRERALKSPPAAARHTGPAPAPTRLPSMLGQPPNRWETEAHAFAARLEESARASPKAKDAPATGGRSSPAHPGLGPSPPSLAGAITHALPHSVRRRFEAGTGLEPGSLPIVTGPAVEVLALAVGARAFTQHGRIHLASEASLRDDALLAYEAAHVLQQTWPADRLRLLGLSPAPATQVLRQPDIDPLLAARRQAREEIEETALAQLLLPASVRIAANWIGDDTLPNHAYAEMARALDATLAPFRQLQSQWLVLQREMQGFSARNLTWKDIRRNTDRTDDPSLVIGLRGLAKTLPVFLGPRWNEIRQVIANTIAVAGQSSRQWQGTASLLPAVSFMLIPLTSGLRHYLDEFAVADWLQEDVRVAFGAPAGVKGPEALASWVEALHTELDVLIHGLGGPAGNLQSAQFDLSHFSKLAGLNATARPLAANFSAIADILDKPEGFIRERAKLAALLKDLRKQLPALTTALAPPRDSLRYALSHFGDTLEMWAAAPVLQMLFEKEFDWLATSGVEFEKWISTLEPPLLEAAGECLADIDRWSGLAAETVAEADTLDEEVPTWGKGWRRILLPIFYLNKARQEIIDTLLKKVPLFRELIESAAGLWERAKTHFARFKERIFKEGRILAPLWEFFLNVLGLELPAEFVSDVSNRGSSLLGKILKHPIRFLKNLANGIFTGLQRFGENIGDHLLNSLLEWLLGEFDLSLPVTFGKILGKLAEHFLNRRLVCERIAAYLKGKGYDTTPEAVETKLDRAIKVGATALRWLVYLFQGKFAEFWEEIKQHLVKLWQWVVDRAVSYVVDQLKKGLIKWVARFIDPTGLMAAFNAIKTIYEAIRTFAQHVERLITIVREVFRAIREIAEGQIERAAAWVEGAAAKGLTVLIGFLANVTGLHSVVEFLKKGLEELKKLVVRAIDALVALTREVWEWLMEKAKQAKDWLTNKSTFEDESGTEELFFEVEGSGTAKVAVLYVEVKDTAGQVSIQRARKKTLGKYLDDLKPANAREKKLLGEAKTEAAKIDKIKSDSGGSFSKSDGEFIHIHFNEILLRLNELGGVYATPPATVAEWKTKNIYGDAHGWKMTAEPLSTDPGGLVGSKPVGTDTALWNKVKGYYDGGDTHYIKGHLLNHNLHGPGIWQNMTPIARRTNTEMESVAEKHVKDAVITENKVVHYEVGMIYGDHRTTPKTNAEEELPSEITMAAWQLTYQKGKWKPNGVDVVKKKTLENKIR